MSRVIMHCIRFRKPVILPGQFFNRICDSKFWRKRENEALNRGLFVDQHLRTFCSEKKDDRGEYEMKDPKSEDEVVNVVYVSKDGHRLPVRGKVGDNILFLAHKYNIDLEGACGGALACSTCHVYVQPEYADKLVPSDTYEDDMLDTAADVTENSRLGCQVKLTKDMEGMEITLPAVTRNFYVDGHVPKPH